MLEQIHRLLSVYDFFDRAIKDHCAGMSAAELTALSARRDQAFMELLALKSNDPRVTFAQLHCVVSSLSDLAGEGEKIEPLRAACHATLDRHRANLEAASRLQVMAAARRKTGSRPRRDNGFDFSLFDHLTDRVGIIDRDYRYIYTNDSNASYHGMTPTDFVGQASWSIVGRKCFDNVTKPLLDSCINEGPTKVFTGHGWAGLVRTWLVSVDPVKSADGRILCLVMAAKDVTGLAIPPESIEMLPMDWSNLRDRNMRATAGRRARRGE